MLWLTAIGVAGRGGRTSSATPTAGRGSTRSSSPARTGSSSGPSPATPAACTACSAAPRPSQAGTTARTLTSRPRWRGTTRSARRRCWHARAATTASSCCAALAPTVDARATCSTPPPPRLVASGWRASRPARAPAADIEERPVLVLTRRSNQSIMIGDDIEISVLSTTRRQSQDRHPRSSQHPGVPPRDLSRDRTGADRCPIRRGTRHRHRAGTVTRLQSSRPPPSAERQ